MFTWIGAAVEVPRRVHKLLGTLGPKLYFFRLKADERQEEDYVEALLAEDYPQKRKALVDALSDYLTFFERGPAIEIVAGIPKIMLEHGDKENLRVIVRLAKLLGRLRGVIPTWETSGTEGAHYAYSLPTVEMPDRAITLLYNLARGHALSDGRTRIDSRDISVLIGVVLSTAPVERVAIFDLLLAHDGHLTTTEITKALNTTNPTARRTMTELKALGLVTEDQEGSSHEWRITLKEEFAWFESEQFKALRGGQNSFGGSDPVGERKLAPMEGQNEMTMKCPYCNHTTETYDELERHAVNVHPGRPFVQDWEIQAACAHKMGYSIPSVNSGNATE
jgi:DNA-binding transcriptional ArsR family regulator